MVIFQNAGGQPGVNIKWNVFVSADRGNRRSKRPQISECGHDFSSVSEYVRMVDSVA